MESSDQDLASRCRNGDEKAWESLVRRYHRKVWNVAYHFTGRAAEADELAQEIFMHMLGALKSYDSSGNLGAWLLRVSRNYAIDNYRRHRREMALTVDVDDEHEIFRRASDPSASADPYVALERKDLAGWIRLALERLPQELRQAVILRDLQEMSYEEMVVLLGVPLGTVKSRINRGRLELARQLRRRRAEWSRELDDRG